jgi:hypothetical protein
MRSWRGAENFVQVATDTFNSISGFPVQHRNGMQNRRSASASFWQMGPPVPPCIQRATRSQRCGCLCPDCMEWSSSGAVSCSPGTHFRHAGIGAQGRRCRADADVGWAVCQIGCGRAGRQSCPAAMDDSLTLLKQPGGELKITNYWIASAATPSAIKHDPASRRATFPSFSSLAPIHEPIIIDISRAGAT